ncbi:hypothetical protein K450DRAFT_227041 [Umbelopsis ramanniana AG]|uniref:Uncharacterized protein n=1 Tax=Umbelopsis ramanniana AG TaxID=1314678 RepID=A0AAD5HHP0_UMBRA|nr:uncharacterized protein K450DRAFT_227041 [Umbelopsis ramanniana AG]KAI8582408.1 hypothetical protein K450DRAFT_227041 [Umbelopsis ramanniana AG]
MELIADEDTVWALGSTSPDTEPVFVLVGTLVFGEDDLDGLGKFSSGSLTDVEILNESRAVEELDSREVYDQRITNLPLDGNRVTNFDSRHIERVEGKSVTDSKRVFISSHGSSLGSHEEGSGQSDEVFGNIHWGYWLKVFVELKKNSSGNNSLFISTDASRDNENVICSVWRCLKARQCLRPTAG